MSAPVQQALIDGESDILFILLSPVQRSKLNALLAGTQCTRTDKGETSHALQLIRPDSKRQEDDEPTSHIVILYMWI